MEIIKKECLELKSKYGDERKTIILDGGDEELDMEDLIQDEDVVITITNSGYVKRLPLDMYRQQKRGGTGSTATSTKEEDFVKDLFVTNTHSNVLFFSDKGRVYWLKAFRFGYSPDTITVNSGNKIRIIINNTDTIHGIYIPDFNVHDRDVVEFIANKTGEFTWYCNTFCGQDHKQMIGKLLVKED